MLSFAVLSVHTQAQPHPPQVIHARVEYLCHRPLIRLTILNTEMQLETEKHSVLICCVIYYRYTNSSNKSSRQQYDAKKAPRTLITTSLACVEVPRRKEVAAASSLPNTKGTQPNRARRTGSIIA